MADAKVIPFGDDSRARRKGARTRAARGRQDAAPPRTPAAPAPGQPPLVSVPSAASAASAGAAGAAGAESAEGRGAGIPPQGAAGRAQHNDERAAEGETPMDDARTGPPPLSETLGAVADRLLGGPWERKVASGLAFLRRRVTGDYEVDEFGYDAELTDQVLMSLLRPLFEKYFRVEVKGIENIPAEGGALVVFNHSGTLPVDGLMAQVAVHDHHPAGRHLRLLAADLVFVLPVINELARKAGHTLACTEDAQSLLERGRWSG